MTEGHQFTFPIIRSGSTPAETFFFSTVFGTASFTDGDYATTSFGQSKMVPTILRAYA